MLRFHDTDPERIRRRLEEIAAVEGARRRTLLWSLGAMVASVTVSLLIMGWGFSMADAEVGPTVFFGGAFVGNMGILLTLLRAYRVDEE